MGKGTGGLILCIIELQFYGRAKQLVKKSGGLRFVIVFFFFFANRNAHVTSLCVFQAAQ